MSAKETTTPLLLVSGAWENMRPDGRTPSETTLKALNRAFEFMSYDVGLIAKVEADTLTASGIVPRPWQKTARDQPYTEVTSEDGHRIGFLRFPSLPEGEITLSAKQFGKLSGLIAAKKKIVDVLIGLSDWGWVAENDYLQQNPEAVPDFLLGSGSGTGINGRILADDRCVWVRPYDKGRSLAEIQIYEWPVRKNSFAWKETKNYKTTSIGMNDLIKENPEVGALFP